MFISQLANNSKQLIFFLYGTLRQEAEQDAAERRNPLRECILCLEDALSEGIETVRIGGPRGNCLGARAI